MGDQPVQLTLSADQALVLFEWLSVAENEERDLGDESVDKVLTVMLGQLEALLVTPFEPNYAELLAAARARVLD